MIIDCFLFHNELDMLEGRLKYLYNSVDYFVITESNATFSGIPKKHTLIKNLSRFKQYLDKIVYLPIDVNTRRFKQLLSDVDSYQASAAWKNEYAQRNSLLFGLDIAEDNDIVMISDVDEIPNLSQLNKAFASLSTNSAVALEQQMFYFNLNTAFVDPWIGTIITTKAHAVSTTPEGYRSNRWSLPRIPNAGWHLSYWYTPDMISAKVKAISHQEYNTSEYNNVDKIKERMLQNRDLFDRDFAKIQIDRSSLPRDFYQCFAGYEVFK